MKLKKIIFIGLIFLYGISNGQKTISIEEHGLNYIDKGLVDFGITHVKDVNGVLDQFVGNWEGESNGKKVKFYIDKATSITKFAKIEIDKLIIRHQTIIDNKIIDDTTSLDASNPLIIEGFYLSETGHYVLNYISRESDCGQSGKIYIKIGENNNVLQCSVMLNPVFIDAEACKDVDKHKFIPKSVLLNRM